MSFYRDGRRPNYALEKWIRNADAICVLGVGLLLTPYFFKNSAEMALLLPFLRNYGWLALTVGSVLLVLGKLLKPQGGYIESVTVWAAPSGYTNVDSQLVPAAPETWNSEVFAGIEWRRFEAVCEALFVQAGFKTASQSHGADRGADIWLFSQHAKGPVAVVRCRHWPNKPVDVRELRDFVGIMALHKLRRGTLVTSSRFTPEAQQFAEANGINALDVERLLELIATRTPVQQKALLDIAHDGEYWRPTCARCGIKLVERVSAGDGTPFWGCANYPGCKSLLLMPKGLPR